MHDVLSSQMAVLKTEQRSHPLWHITEGVPSLFVEPGAVIVDVCLTSYSICALHALVVLLEDVCRNTPTSDVLANALNSSSQQRNFFWLHGAFIIGKSGILSWQGIPSCND